MRFPLFLIVIASAASQLGATDCGQVIRDPGFDLWCEGDRLCTWKVMRGEARRAATWHDKDSGVELLGDDVAIAQLAPVNHHDGECIRFDLVANVSADVDARLGIDVYGDGVFELSERLPAANWKPLSYTLRLEAPYTGIRFELSKRGTGTAVFAQIAAEIVKDCDDLPGIASGPAPLGAYCLEDPQCGSGLCRLALDPGSFIGYSLRCVGCDAELGAAACGAGEACGPGEPGSPIFAVPVVCQPAGTDELSEQCTSDAECASGICNGHACSTCRDPDAACATGEACAAAWELGPSVCAPGAGRRLTGEPCVSSADCASGACNGAVRQVCDDSRPCSSDASCPVDDGLTPGTCTAVGIQGGSCQ